MLGWRWVFLISGVSFLTINLLVTFTVHSEPRALQPRGNLGQFDLVGAVWLMLCVALLLVGIQMIGREGTGLWPLGLILLGTVLVRFLIQFEARQVRPVLPVALFKSRAVSIPSWFNFLFTFTNGISLYLLPILFIQGLHWTAAYAGSILIALNAARPFGSVTSGFLTDKFGPSIVVILSSIVLITSVLSLAVWGASGVLLVLIPILVMFGLGQSLFATANLRQMYSAVPPALLAFAPGALGLGRHIATTAGIGIASTVFAAFLLGEQFLTNEDAVSASFQVIFIATAGFLALGVFAPSGLSFVLSRFSDPKL
jgi:DHA2 family multidrug resistance protein-like MFS transporter